MEYLNQKDLFKHVRFTNTFYRTSDDKIYCFDDEAYFPSTDMEIVLYHKQNCIFCRSEGEYDCFITLSEYRNNGTSITWYAKVDDLCSLSDSPNGWLRR